MGEISDRIHLLEVEDEGSVLLDQGKENSDFPARNQKDEGA